MALRLVGGTETQEQAPLAERSAHSRLRDLENEILALVIQDKPVRARALALWHLYKDPGITGGADTAGTTAFLAKLREARDCLPAVGLRITEAAVRDNASVYCIIVDSAKKLLRFAPQLKQYKDILLDGMQIVYR